MIFVASLSLVLAGLYASMTALNLALFRAPAARAGTEARPVSLLIPARDEGRRIEATLAAALASRGVALEVCVLDDHSSDDTAAIVARNAARDPRIRLLSSAPLPAGWNGKQHACAQLAAAAAHDTLVFIDADVRLGPEALARTAGALRDRRLGLVSGFPREITATAGEKLLVPMIGVLLLGYLPLIFARLAPQVPALAAGCGQLMAITRAAYEAAGGHAAIADTMHDGLRLPVNVRRAGYATDIFNAASLAECRMYTGFIDAWQGFSKNAVEGMATPAGLPVWTVLLAGGHLLPFIALGAALTSGASAATIQSAIAVAALIGARVALAVATRQRPGDVLLHPIAVATVLTLQWRALWHARRGAPRVWRGRRYD